jgi:hypothetical protein
MAGMDYHYSMNRFLTADIYKARDEERTLDGGCNQRKDNTAIDMSFQEPKEHTDVAEDGHHECRDDDPIQPIRGLHYLGVVPVLESFVVPKSGL